MRKSRWVSATIVLLGLGCGASGEESKSPTLGSAAAGGSQVGMTATAGRSGTAGATTASAGRASAAPSTPTTPAANGGSAAANTGGVTGGAATAGTTAAAAGAAPGVTPMGGAPSMMPPPPAMTGPAGPVDGDPSKPMVEIPGIPCGRPNISFASAAPTVKITDRDVAVAYPCAHEGAAVTFFLFVHGTLQEEQKIAFTMNAYAVHELVDSHNVIVVTPKAVGTQWGNGDNGVDLPHLHDVVKWTYDTFGTKFNIKSMWAHGGSWGAFYLSTFACDPMLEDKLKGVYMVVGGGCPSCSNRLSCVVIQQELEKGMGMTLSPMQQEMLVDSANIAPYAMQHGCDAKMGPTNVGPVRTWDFPSCDPGWFHSYYLGPGEHADKLDQSAVVKLTDAMKATEP